MRSIDADKHIVMWVVTRLESGTREVLERHFLRGVLSEVLAQIWLASVVVQWRSSAACHDVVHPVLVAQRVLISLDPVLEDMIVSAKRHSHMMLTKQWKITSAKRSSGRLDLRTSV